MNNFLGCGRRVAQVVNLARRMVNGWTIDLRLGSPTLQVILVLIVNR